MSTVTSTPSTASVAEEPIADRTPTWEVRVGEFATLVNKPYDSISAALAALAGEPGPDALNILSDPSMLSDDELKTALVINTDGPKIPLGVFKKYLPKLRGPVLVTEPGDGRTTSGPSFDVLPSVPDDESFLASLKVGGELKVGKTEVLSAVKAAIANKLGLFDLPGIIKDKMEVFAVDQEEPVGKEFFELQKLVTARRYSEVLSALNIEGNFMSESRKNGFLQRLDQYLWVGLKTFSTQLSQWQQAWLAGTSNPGAVMAMLAMSHAAGGAAAIMPPGMMTPPETAGLHDEAEAVINLINKVFAGVGVPVSRALAYDATRIKGVLDNTALPAALGFSNRDQMLKGLGLSVGADFVRLERNITRFVLAIMEFPKITVPNEEYAYLAAMIQLSSTIPWEKIDDLGVGGERAGLGRRANPRRRGDEEDL